MERGGSNHERHRIVALATSLCNMRPHDKRDAQSPSNSPSLPHDAPPCLPLLPFFTSGESESEDNEQATRDDEGAQPLPLFDHMHIMQLK
jgi:hypothetical protein